MKHAQPYGLTVAALVAATFAALILLSFALNRLHRPRQPRAERQPATMRPVPGYARDTEAYEPPSWTAHREDPQ